MLSKIILPAVVAAVAALLTPSAVDAYGACHVGYTHVGPNGVYHAGATAAGGYGGAYHAGYGGAYHAGYGGAYHAGYGGAYHAGYGGAYGGAAGGYHYQYHYSGGSSPGVYNCGSIR